MEEIQCYYSNERVICKAFCHVKFCFIGKKVLQGVRFPLRKWYKITIGQDIMWPGHIKIAFISSHSAGSLLHIWCKWVIRHDNSTGMGQGQTKCVVCPSSFFFYGSAGLSPSSQGWKYTTSFSRSPWGKLSFLGENKSAPSVKEFPVAPKFGDAKCSPRVCFCFSWQLTHPTSYEPFNSNCLPHVPSSSTPWITGWDHPRLLMI